MTDDPLAQVLVTQARVCASFGSHFYAGLLDRAAADLAPPARALFAAWEGRPAQATFADAVALRFLGALHDLVLAGDAPELAAAFPPTADVDGAWRAARAAIEAHGERIVAFMAHEPQTNEVRRSACLLPGFLTIAGATGLPLRCFELGASAGLNQLWPRYRYSLGAAGAWGDPASPLSLTTDWSGPPPPLDAPIRIVESAACDRKPVDLSDPAQRRRLKAYLWPDQPERLERLDAAIAIALAAGVTVERADAAEWAERTAAPRPGAATVIYHSVFWQYLPGETQTALAALIEARGAATSASAPLAWLCMEPPPGPVLGMQLRLTLWPGGQTRVLADVHPHGASVNWRG